MESFPRPLTPKEEAFWLQKYKAGDVEAKNCLIVRNLRLVAHIVKKYMSSGKEQEELISVGIIGLVKAVNSFDVDKGHKLVTYAARCIENEILMLLRGDKKLRKEISLYEPIGRDKEGNEISLFDVVESDDKEALEKIIIFEDIRHLYKMMDRVLTEREKQVIILRYGLFEKKPVTQREIAEAFGISRSYVSRIEKRAVEKLRRCF